MKGIFINPGVLECASRLPSGLIDPKSPQKLVVEANELLSATDDLGKVMEAADVAYYAAKAIMWAANEVGLSTDDLFQIVLAKYSCRALPGNPKNDVVERKAVSIALGRNPISAEFSGF